jgi:hypothetical protein
MVSKDFRAAIFEIYREWNAITGSETLSERSGSFYAPKRHTW